VQDTLHRVVARFILETGRWKTQPVTKETPAVELLATGISAIKLGDLKLATKAAKRLQRLAEEASKEKDTSYYSRTGKPLSIMHKEVAGMLALAKGKTPLGLKLLEEGVAIAESMRPPNGAPNPVIPVHELYAQALFDTGSLTAAIALFETSLRRTPNRPQSLLGLARSYVASGNPDAGRAQYQKLAEVWQGRDFPASLEVSEYLVAAQGE